MKCTFIGSGSDEVRYSFQDTKSHQVFRSRDITFVDSIYEARSSDTSEGSENSKSFEDSGRLDEEYSEDGASFKKGGSETLHVRRSNTKSRAPVSDVHQVGDEREVEVLRSFNWPPIELITEDGLLPDRERVQRVLYVRRYRKVRAVALLKGSVFCMFGGTKRLGTSVVEGKVVRSLQRLLEIESSEVISLQSGTGGPTTLERVASCIVGREAYCSTEFEGRIVGCKSNPTLHGACSLARVVQFFTIVQFSTIMQFGTSLSSLYSLFVRAVCGGAIYHTQVCIEVCAGVVYPNSELQCHCGVVLSAGPGLSEGATTTPFALRVVVELWLSK
nr:hypothetical protein [Tanacetum cinerariifolium]